MRDKILLKNSNSLLFLTVGHIKGQGSNISMLILFLLVYLNYAEDDLLRNSDMRYEMCSCTYRFIWDAIQKTFNEAPLQNIIYNTIIQWQNMTLK